MASDQQDAPKGRRGARRDGPRAEDEQLLMKRRAIAGGIGIVVLIVVVFGVRGCLETRNDRAMRDYVNDVSALVASSQEVSQAFFDQLSDPGDAGVTDIEAQINAQRLQATQHVNRAKKLDTPSAMKASNRYLIDALELRRDGLAEIGRLIAPALGDEDSDQAVKNIAAQMMNFLASDVIYSQRAYPGMARALRDENISTDRVPESEFLKSIDWLDPTKVGDVLSRARGAAESKTIAPGAHGTGITSVKVLPSGNVVTDGGSANLQGAESIQIEIQNQGENDEKEIDVVVKISGVGDLKDSIAEIKRGETATATIPLTKTPSGSGNVDVRIEVIRVPGEKNLDNNKLSFSASFGS